MIFEERRKCKFLKNGSNSKEGGHDRKCQYLVHNLYSQTEQLVDHEALPPPLFYERRKNGPHDLVGLLLGGLRLQVEVEQVSHPFHRDVVVIVI